MTSQGYSVNGVGVEYNLQLDNGRFLRFRASDMRREKTGIHGRISIIYDSYVMAWTNGNMERHEDRQRLMNSALKTSSGKSVISEAIGGVELSNDKIHHEFSMFCLKAWPAYVGSLKPELLEGSIGAPTKFLAFPHVIEEGGTVLFALPGRGKSYTAMLLAVSIDAGISTLWKVEQKPVLFVNLERGAKGVQHRFGLVNRILGEPPNRPILLLNARGKTLMDVKEPIAEAVKEHGIGCVVLDSISRAGQGDLNDNQPMNRIVDTLNGICPTWFALAHTPRGDESHAFGSLMLDAGADIMLQLMSARNGEKLGIGLKITKGNDIAPQPTMVLAFEFSPEGLSAAYKAKMSDFPEMQGQQKMSLVDELIHWLLNEAGSATATQAASALNLHRPSVSSAFRNDSKFTIVRKEGREVVYGVKTSVLSES